MKTLLLSFLLLGLCRASAAEPAAPAAYVPIKIIDSVRPVFPSEMLQQGYDDGTVRLVVMVDADGRLGDQLVTAYTHRVFANSALTALKGWRFEPARLNGVPIGSTREIVVSFERRGMIIVTQGSNDIIDARLSRLDTAGYAAASLRELDRIPTPITLVQPLYGPELANEGVAGRLTVDFFIDEEGRARMPSVHNSVDQRLVDSAIAAVAQWRFTPPTVRGRPALVRASQTFAFEPVPAKSAAVK